jgi:hypothetical protein
MSALAQTSSEHAAGEQPTAARRAKATDGLCAGLCEAYARPVGRTGRRARAMRSEDGMKFVYVVTTGTDDPTKASLPLHLAANGSVEVGHDTSVLLAGDATEILFGDNLDQMQGIGVPPVRDLVAKLRDHSVPVYV